MKLIVLDFETFYGDGYTLSQKDVTTESYIRDERFKVHGVGVKINGGPSKWVTGRLVKPVLDKLNLQEHVVIGHNLQFDGSILAWHYGIYPKLYIDTLALSRSLVGPHSAKHGLKYVAEKLCNMTKMDALAKSYNIRDLSPSLEAEIADYCVGAPRWNEAKQLTEAGDTELTWEIFKRLIKYLPKSEYEALDWTIRAFTNPRLILDTAMLDRYGRELELQKAEALRKAGLEDRGLLMSNPKFAAALEELGVTPPTKISPKTGKVSFAFAKTDEGLKTLLEHPDPEVQALVAARLEHKSTIEQTRTAAYLEASRRGPWPVAYNYAGATVTQRYSGNRGGGGNPQNLARGGTLRRSIMAPDGYVIGVADLSQIEARIVLWLGMQITGPDGEEAKALQVMAEGGDIYGWFGTKIYGVEINKHDTPNERQVSKSAVLGLGFGMGAVRFMDYCVQMGIQGVDDEFAEFIIKLYRNTFTGVKKFWWQCNKAVNFLIEQHAELITPLEIRIDLPGDGMPLVRTCLDPLFHDNAIQLPNGLCIKYPNLQKGSEGEITYQDGNKRIKLFGGKITENIVQAVAAEIMREQKTKLNKRYPVVMTTHDELVCLVPENDQEGFHEAAHEIMCAPVSYLPGLPMGIETGVSKRYGDAK